MRRQRSSRARVRACVGVAFAGVLARAAARGALLLLAGSGARIRLRHQAFAFARFGLVEGAPPFAEFGVEFARGAAQQQEVVAGAEARIFQQFIRRAAGAAFEARLHGPDVAHVGGDAALQGQVLGLRFQHVVGGQVQRRDRRFAGGAVGGPLLQHLVPQQRGEQEARRHALAGFDARVGGFEGQGHELHADRLLQHDVEQRQQTVVQAGRAQLLQAGQRVARQQQFEHLVEHARGRDVVDQRRHHGDRCARGRLDREAEFRREAHHAQHAHRVFAVARLGHADDAQGLVADVLDAAVVVQHRLRGRIVVHRVDGEVAARGVLVLGAEVVVAQDAAMLVLRRVGAAGAAEGRHFQQLLAEHHVHDLEAAADDEGAAEQFFHLLRRGVGGDVEILRFHAQQQVAHGAADDEGLEAGFLQGLGQADRVRRQQLRVDAVLLEAEDHRLGGIALVFHAKDFTNEFFNH